MGKEVRKVGSEGAEAIIPLKGRDGVSPCCLPISSAFLSPCHLEAFPFPSKPDILVAHASKESIEPALTKKCDTMVAFSFRLFTSVHFSCFSHVG